MSESLLENIIQLEKQLQAELAAEERRSQAWRERELAQLDAALAVARRESERGDQAAEEAARMAAHAEGEALLRSAEEWCGRLQALEEDWLRNELVRHLVAILPKEDDDHPHGQG